MHRRHLRLIPTLTSALLVTALLAPAALAEDMTLEELMAKNAEARGGEEAFDAVQNAKVWGKMSMGQGMEAPLTLYVQEPGKMRMDMEFQGATITQAWNGESGWQIMPLMGVTEAQEMSEDEAKQMKRQDFVRGLLLTAEEKGYEAEYMGIEEVEGTEAHKVKITLEEGEVVYSYLDTDYFMEFMQKIEGTNPQTGQAMNVTVTYGDFKPVADLMIAHSMEMRPEGAPAGNAITIEKIEVNTDEVTADLFEMPETVEGSTGGEG